MKVSDYLPNLYKKNVEMTNIINSEEIELNKVEIDIMNSFKNTFITNANIEGINQFEKLFNIVSNSNTEDVETRRKRILSRLISQIPFTEKYLIDYLDRILGKNNWSYNLDYNNYMLTINSLAPGRLWYNELVQFLNRVIPVNIEWQIEIFEASWQSVNENFNTWQDVLNMTWQDVLNGEWLN
jgi:hypothetical protein